LVDEYSTHQLCLKNFQRIRKPESEKRKKVSDFRISPSAFPSSLTEKQRTVSRQSGFVPRVRARSAKGGSLIKIK